MGREVPLTVRFAARFATSGCGRFASTGEQTFEPAMPLYEASHFGLFSYFQRVVHLDSEILHRALKPRMSEQELNCAKVLGPR